MKPPLTLVQIKEMETEKLEHYYRLMCVARNQPSNEDNEDLIAKAVNLGLVVRIYSRYEISELGNAVMDRLYHDALKTVAEWRDEYQAEYRRNEAYRRLLSLIIDEGANIEAMLLYHSLVSEP